MFLWTPNCMHNSVCMGIWRADAPWVSYNYQLVRDPKSLRTLTENIRIQTGLLSALYDPSPNLGFQIYYIFNFLAPIYGNTFISSVLWSSLQVRSTCPLRFTPSSPRTAGPPTHTLWKKRRWGTAHPAARKMALPLSVHTVYILEGILTSIYRAPTWARSSTESFTRSTLMKPHALWEASIIPIFTDEKQASDTQLVNGTLGSKPRPVGKWVLRSLHSCSVPSSTWMIPAKISPNVRFVMI